MKKIILAAVAALGLASAASGATYSVDVTAQPFRVPGSPGLQTRAFVLATSGTQNFGGVTGLVPVPFSFNLTNIGDSVNVPMFGMVHFDVPLNADDLVPKAMTVTLNLGAYGIGIINGVTYGVGTPLAAAAYAVADYTNDYLFNLGNGTAIKASIADITFGSDASGIFVNGRKGFGLVTANFTLSQVPLPATLPLGLAALGLLGFVARRRKGASLV